MSSDSAGPLNVFNGFTNDEQFYTGRGHCKGGIHQRSTEYWDPSVPEDSVTYQDLTSYVTECFSRLGVKDPRLIVAAMQSYTVGEHSLCARAVRVLAPPYRGFGPNVTNRGGNLRYYIPQDLATSWPRVPASVQKIVEGGVPAVGEHERFTKAQEEVALATIDSFCEVFLHPNWSKQDHVVHLYNTLQGIKMAGPGQVLLVAVSLNLGLFDMRPAATGTRTFVKDNLQGILGRACGPTHVPPGEFRTWLYKAWCNYTDKPPGARKPTVMLGQLLSLPNLPQVTNQLAKNMLPGGSANERATLAVKIRTFVARAGRNNQIGYTGRVIMTAGDRAVVTKLLVERGLSHESPLVSDHMAQQVLATLRAMGVEPGIVNWNPKEWSTRDTALAVVALKIHSPRWWRACGFEDVSVILPFHQLERSDVARAAHGLLSLDPEIFRLLKNEDDMLAPFHLTFNDFDDINKVLGQLLTVPGRHASEEDLWAEERLSKTLEFIIGPRLHRRLRAGTISFTTTLPSQQPSLDERPMEQLCQSVPATNDHQEYLRNQERTDIVQPYRVHLHKPGVNFDQDQYEDEDDEEGTRGARVQPDDDASGDEDEGTYVDEGDDDEIHCDSPAAVEGVQPRYRFTTDNERSMMSRFDGQLKTFLVALIDLDLSGSSATFSDLMKKANVLLPFVHHCMVNNDRQGLFTSVNGKAQLVDRDRHTSLAPCLFDTHMSIELLQAQMAWMLSTHGQMSEILLAIAHSENPESRTAPIPFEAFKVRHMPPASTIKWPGLLLVNPFGTCCLFDMSFSMGLRLRTVKYNEGSAASGKRRAVASHVAFPDQMYALMWFDDSAPQFLPTLPVPMGAVYAANTITILMTGAATMSVVELENAARDFASSMGSDDEPEGDILGLNSNTADPGCPLRKHAGISMAAALKVVAKVVELSDAQTTMPIVASSNPYTTSKAREFYDKHFSGIFPPGLGLFTIGRYMSLKRSVMVHAIDTFEKENPGREVDTYFIASTSYSRYRASFDKDLAHVPRFRMVVLPEE